MRKIKLTMTEGSQFGMVLFKVWYFNKDLLDLAPGLSGCPHHGGEHSFSIQSADDNELLAFLKLFVETYPEAATEIELVKDAIDEDEKSISLKTLLSNRKPYLLWQRCGKGEFAAPNGLVYNQFNLIRANFEARRDILMGKVDKPLKVHLLDILERYTPER